MPSPVATRGEVGFGRASIKLEFAASPTLGDFRHDKQPNTDIRLAPLETGCRRATRIERRARRAKAQQLSGASD